MIPTVRARVRAMRAPVLRPSIDVGRRALRDLGFALGLFVAANLAGEAVRAPFATLSDWVSLPHAPILRVLVAGAASVVLLANGWRARDDRLCRAARVAFGLVAAVAAVDTVRFYGAVARETIHTPALLPASVVVAVLFGALAVECRPDPSPMVAPRRLPRAFAIAALLVGLPVVRMFTFGPTRYERPAACAIVFGARVWNDGTPSDALADRVDEAIALYHRGLAGKLVMSGGVEPENGLSEAEVMRARAVAAGVPGEDVLLDEAGVTTARTVRNTAELMRRERLASALVVTHYYHEPRAKMLFDRAGVRAFTVPATMKRRLYKEPYFLAREVVAYWLAFLVD